MNPQGRVLKMFVMGRSANSLKMIELANWTGICFAGDRQQIASIRSRPELDQPAVYLLIGPADDESGLSKVYVGETDSFLNRVSDHLRNKDWWDKFVVFTAQDLNKAHVKFLEREIFLIARKSLGTVQVENLTEPGGSRISESDRTADCE